MQIGQGTKDRLEKRLVVEILCFLFLGVAEVSLCGPEDRVAIGFLPTLILNIPLRQNKFTWNDFKRERTWILAVLAPIALTGSVIESFIRPHSNAGFGHLLDIAMLLVVAMVLRTSWQIGKSQKLT